MGKKISNIVFTKNRPLQLEAYLESLYYNIPKELIQTYIIYKEEQFDEQYSQVFSCFPDCVVIREKNFHDDLIRLLDQIDTKYVLLGTDDVVYFDSFSFATVDETFDRFFGDMFGFSLRLDPESLQRENEIITKVRINNENVYRVNWKNAKSRNGKYPFELNSTIYRTVLVKEIVSHISKEHPVLKRIFPKWSVRVKFLSYFISMKDFLASLETFHNPNTFEGYCYRWCKTHKRKFPDYLYFQKHCASAIQVNRVNTSVYNPTDGLNEHTVEALNEKYKSGYRFDIGVIEKSKPQATHVGREYFRLVKRA